MFLSRALAFSSLVLLSGVNVAVAIPITSPSSLSIGDQYRLAFLTSSGRDASSADIDDYNDFVQSHADAVPELLSLGATWKAIASTPTVDARDNTNTNPLIAAGVPIFLLNDTKLVDDNADLWDGSIDHWFNVDESGVEDIFQIPTATVWTGTNHDGVADGSAHDGLPDGHHALGGIDIYKGRGHAFSSSASWIDGPGAEQIHAFQLYAISSVLTVVPEPTTAALAISATLFIAARRRS